MGSGGPLPKQANPSLDLPLFTANQAPTLPLLWNCHPAPTPPPTLSCNQGPWSTPPSTRPAPVGTPPHPTGPSKNASFFLYALETTKNTTHVDNFRWVPLPTPQGILQKTPFFFFLYALETTKIRHTLKFAPCPYHLTPPEPKPLDPPPEPLPRQATSFII